MLRDWYIYAAGHTLLVGPCEHWLYKRLKTVSAHRLSASQRPIRIWVIWIRPSCRRSKMTVFIGDCRFHNFVHVEGLLSLYEFKTCAAFHVRKIGIEGKVRISVRLSDMGRGCTNLPSMESSQINLKRFKNPKNWKSWVSVICSRDWRRSGTLIINTKLTNRLFK